jgi:hypothetical protein
VGIENGGFERLNEYVPFEQQGMCDGLVRKFLHIRHLSSLLWSNYRTLPKQDTRQWVAVL